MKRASRFVRLDGAPCVPSATFELCMACNGSELHRRCEWRDRQAWCARAPPRTGRRAFQCGGIFRNASAVYAAGLPLGPPPIKLADHPWLGKRVIKATGAPPLYNATRRTQPNI